MIVKAHRRSKRMNLYQLQKKEARRRITFLKSDLHQIKVTKMKKIKKTPKMMKVKTKKTTKKMIDKLTKLYSFVLEF